jgi:phosphohistidine phosphatase SixA
MLKNMNLYIVRHGKVNTDEKMRAGYLHLSDKGIDFASMLDRHFKDTYFDRIFYQSTDLKTSDPYNCCQQTVRGLKGIKSEFDKAHVSMVFEELNKEGADVRNVILCFRSDSFHVISNIISPQSEEQFSKDYHRVFHYRFDSNRYSFVGKFSAEEVQ